MMKNDVIQEELFSSIGASPLTHMVYVKLHTSIIIKLGVTLFAKKKKNRIYSTNGFIAGFLLVSLPSAFIIWLTFSTYFFYKESHIWIWQTKISM